MHPGKQASRPGLVSCVASVSVGFSARSRHFSLSGDVKIGASATLMKGAGRGRGGKPSSTETLLTQASRLEIFQYAQA